MFLVIIVIGDATFDRGRFPMPRAKAANPGWTSWGGHGIVEYLIEFYTCPGVLRFGFSCTVYVCRWKGKYTCTFSKEMVADRILQGGEGERGGLQQLNAELVMRFQHVACLSLFVRRLPHPSSSLFLLHDGVYQPPNFVGLYRNVARYLTWFMIRNLFLIFTTLSSCIFHLRAWVMFSSQ